MTIISSLVSLFFNSKMTVTEQFWSYDFMAYIAENGGFVGLFLGYSLLQLEELVTFLAKKVQPETEESVSEGNFRDTVSTATECEIEKEVFDLVFDIEQNSKETMEKKKRKKKKKKSEEEES